MTGKTSVVIEPDLLKQAKRKAMDRGITFQAALDEALRAWLGLPPPAMEEPDVRLRRALEPGILRHQIRLSNGEDCWIYREALEP